MLTREKVAHLLRSDPVALAVELLYPEVKTHTANGALVPGFNRLADPAVTAMTLPALSAPSGRTIPVIVINETGAMVTITAAGDDEITGGTNDTTYELEATPGIVTLNDFSTIWSAVPRL